MKKSNPEIFEDSFDISQMAFQRCIKKLTGFVCWNKVGLSHIT